MNISPPKPEKSDTAPAVERMMIEGYRTMSAARKMNIVSQMSIAVQQMALARIRQKHPHATEHERKLRLASLWLDRKTMIKIWNWDSDKEGF